ncbi:MAG: hypothetical protein ACE5IH_05275, partial [Thermodesulfobacteriota bacterium]
MEKRRFVGGLLGLFLLSLMVLTVGAVPIYGGQGGVSNLPSPLPSPLMVEGKGGGENRVESGLSPETLKEPDDAAKVKLQASYGKLPLYFIQNDGQVDEKVKFYE